MSVSGWIAQKSFIYIPRERAQLFLKTGDVSQLSLETILQETRFLWCYGFRKYPLNCSNKIQYSGNTKGQNLHLLLKTTLISTSNWMLDYVSGRYTSLQLSPREGGGTLAVFTQNLAFCKQTC